MQRGASASASADFSRSSTTLGSRLRHSKYGTGSSLGSSSSLDSGASSSSSCSDDELEEAWQCTPRPESRGQRLWLWLFGNRGGRYLSNDSVCQYWVWKRRCKRFTTLLIINAHLVIQAYFWHRMVCSDRTEIMTWPAWVVWFANFLSITLPLCCWLAFEYLRVESSAAARQAGLLFLYFWFAQVVGECAMVFRTRFWWRTRAFIDPGKFWMTLWAVWWRVSTAEHAFEVSGASTAIMIIGLGEIFVPIMRLYFIIEDMYHGIYRFITPVSDRAYRCAAFLACGLICWIRFTRILVVLKEKRSILTAKKYLYAEASWAQFVLRRVRRGLILVCGAGAVSAGLELYTALKAVSKGDWTHSWIFLFDVPTNVYLLFDFITLLDTVGFFMEKQPTLERSQMSTGKRKSEEVREVLGEVIDAHEPDHPPKRSSTWRKTVKTLAGRYIEAGEVLDFYAGLRQIMPWYEPRVHTTNDIVRAAIIPLTNHAGRGVALANTLGRATVRGVYPERMVTHDWRNLFLHLVAAVLADALEQEEYSDIADVLCWSNGIDILRQELEATGQIHLKYWICAFCVNQHAGICGGFPPPPPPTSKDFPRWDANRRDSVTGELHSICFCKEEKYFLDTPDKCEMNKFDDMMELLSREVPNFKQLVAIDRHFDLFTRVWCVAELVEAYIAQIPQNVCLLNKQALDANTGDLGVYIKLATLTVADCSATCPEDKEIIMGKIPDVAEFDAQLQTAIFGSSGLLGKQLVGFDVVYTAARTALRVKAASRPLALQKTAYSRARIVGSWCLW